MCPVDVTVDGDRSAQLRSFETTGGELGGTRIDEPSALPRWPVIAAFSREGEWLVYVGKASDAGSERFHFVPFEAASPRLDHRFSLELPGTVRRSAWQP